MGVIMLNGIAYGGDNFFRLTQAEYDALTPYEQTHGNYCITDAGATGDLAQNNVTYTSGDDDDTNITPSTGWTTVAKMTSAETLSSLFNKVSTMAKNVRWLWKVVTSVNDPTYFASGKQTITPDECTAYYPCYYVKVGGVVYVYLAISGLTANVSAHITTLPVGFRPANSIVPIGRGRSLTHFARFSLGNAGDLNIMSEDDRAFVAFSFIAEQ